MLRTEQNGSAATAPLPAGPCCHRPVGLIAALLAAMIATGGALAGQAYAVRVAGRYLQAVNLQQVPIKWESLTFQRAALASDHWLPLYGSSELYCCGDPYRGQQLFLRKPTGFDVFAVGRAGTTDLFFLETFGALGDALRGKRIVISDSPQWYFNPDGVSAQAYAGNFSPEIADAFVFDAPLPLSLRQMAARRMLTYPKTLEGRALLRLALVALADGSPARLAGYYALSPAGRIDTFFQELQDAYQTVKFIHQHKEYRPDLAAEPRTLNWPLLLASGTTIAADDGAADPFGFPPDIADRLRTQQQYRSAMALYCSGGDDRNMPGTAFSASWEATMQHSAGWGDLRLELQALDELGVQPLVYTIPMPGLWYDEIGIPVRARDDFYQNYMDITRQAHIPALDFRSNDEDRFFLHDTGAHLSARGWIYVDRAINMFWHGRSIDDVRATMLAMNRQVPPVGLPDPRETTFCRR
jgi:D-alanine transfer protein